jgi:hypothetical protein
MPSRSQQRLAAIKASRSRALLRMPDPMAEPGPRERAPTALPRPHAKGAIGGGWGMLAATVAGFAVGVVFWHSVGFWSFVHEAVLRGGRTEIARSNPAIGRAEPETVRLGALAPAEPDETVAGDACALSSRDRAGRYPALKPCRDLAPLTEAAARRWAAGEVRGPGVAGWSSSVAEDLLARPQR